MRYFACATQPSLSAGSSSTGGTFSRVRYPFRTVSQFELMLTVPCASLGMGDDAELSSATSEGIAAGFARCAARARVRGVDAELFDSSVAAAASGAGGIGNFAISAKVVACWSATLQLHVYVWSFAVIDTA